MNWFVRLCLASFVSIAWITPARAVLIRPVTASEQLHDSAAVFRGRVLAVQSYLDFRGHIRTRVTVQVEEVFKGQLPSLVQLDERGGVYGGRAEVDDFDPRFSPGEDRLFFVSRRGDGTLFPMRGGPSAIRLGPAGTTPKPAGAAALAAVRAATATGALPGITVTNQVIAPQSAGRVRPLGMSPSSTATNLISGPGTIGPRFLQPDRGEPIPYLIDADYLPTGVTLTQAVSAVQSAINAWAAATSLKFQFAGIQSFGMAAGDVDASDGALRIQLHDHYHFTGGGTGDGVAVGGQGSDVSSTPSGWSGGGNVIGNDFYQTVAGYVVVQSTNEVFQTVSTLAECLCHEIGHAIGLGHSSEDPNEPSPVLKQAIMYYALHADGRGAALNICDTNVVRQIYPPLNTPPYAYGRILDAVTTPNPISIPGVNSAQILGFDLQTASSNLVFETGDDSKINGSFTSAGDTITYVPNAFYGDTARFDPAGSSFYDIVYARYSDGTNASPFVSVRVLSYNADSYSEGIPDSWRSAFFGDSDPSAGPGRHAGDDFDGDGYSNIQEYWLGSDPTDPGSNLRMTDFTTTNLQWQAKGYEVYELFGSTNLVDWHLAMNPLTPLDTNGVATGFTNGGPREFFRISKLP